MIKKFVNFYCDIATAIAEDFEDEPFETLMAFLVFFIVVAAVIFVLVLLFIKFTLVMSIIVGTILFFLFWFFTLVRLGNKVK